MPIATGLAGVNMRLEKGAIRYVWRSGYCIGTVELTHVSELHWHNAAEWAYVLKVSVHVAFTTSKTESILVDRALRKSRP